MEKWDLYTKERKCTGREQIRGEAIPEGLYHLVVHVWIKNRKGEYLISKRAADRPTHPLCWECPGGSVLLGETSLHGAVREVEEEVGIKLKPENGRLLLSKIRDTAMPYLLDVWLFEEEEGETFQPDLAKAETKEVEEVHWRRPEEIQKLYDEGLTVPSIGYFFEQPVIRYENTVQGLFVRRINRFTAEVLLDGTPEIVHVKNTGRLGELLLPDAKVTLQRTENPKRKTAYDLVSVYQPELGWVNIDSLAPNVLMKQQLHRMSYDLVRPEYVYGNSRVDFYMECGKEKYLMEVKGCTLAFDRKKGIGLFPDAPTERGVKHLRELAAAAKVGYHCTIAFVIQMNGIHRVLPNDRTQPEFGQALREAAKAGVQIVFYGCKVEADRIRLTGAIESQEP